MEDARLVRSLVPTCKVGTISNDVLLFWRSSRVNYQRVSAALSWLCESIWNIEPENLFNNISITHNAACKRFSNDWSIFLTTLQQQVHAVSGNRMQVETRKEGLSINRIEGSTQVSTIGQLELSKETIFDLANQVQQPRTPYRDSFVPIQVSIQENQKESSYPTNEKMDRDRSRGKRKNRS